METRPLGASDLRVSLVGLGCNQFGGRLDYDGTKRVIDRALDLGITHIDTADIYGRRGGSEELVGRALGARRKDVVLVTKFAKPMSDTPPKSRGARAYVMSAVEASLKRLNTDWIDLLFMHEPDPSTPMEETFRAIEDLKKSGKVRHFGASNFTADEVAAAGAVAGKIGVEGFVACQDELSLIHRGIERDLVPAMAKLNISLIPYFPLGRRRSDRQIPQGQAVARRAAQYRLRCFTAVPRRRKIRHGREARGLCRKPRSHATRACHELAGGAPAGRFDHHRRDAARSARRQRQGARLETDGGGDGGGGWDNEVNCG